MANKLSVAFPLFRGEGVYKETLLDVIKYIDATTPTETALKNYLLREYGGESDYFVKRGIGFLGSLHFIERNEEDNFQTGPAAHRYLQARANSGAETEEEELEGGEIGADDILFNIFIHRVENFYETLEVINDGATTLEELIEEMDYSETNIRQRINWLKTMGAIEGKPSDIEITTQGKDFLELYGSS